MLLRKAGDGVVAIPQPSHSWLSGQMARAWGNGRFATPWPYAEVCLGAEQHDIGWTSWELKPELDPGTGRPCEFMHVKRATHVALWSDGVRRAQVYGSYPALLVSLHAETIYSRYFDYAHATDDDKHIVQGFLEGQRALRRTLIAALNADGLDAHTAEDALERNRLLVAALDWMSLQICWGVSEEVRFGEVPTRGEERVEMVVRPSRGGDRSVTVDPWPFAIEHLEVQAEGRLLEGRFGTDEEMRSTLEAAPTKVIRTTLIPFEGG